MPEVTYRLVIADDHPLFRGALREAEQRMIVGDRETIGRFRRAASDRTRISPISPISLR